MGDEQIWASRLVAELLEARKQGSAVYVTWLNHFTSLADRNAGVELSGVDYIGVDGLLLGVLMGTRGAGRTSADLVMPTLLHELRPARVALVGGTQESVALAADALRTRFGATVVKTWDGYGGMPSQMEIAAVAKDCDVVLMGLGAPRQDEVLTATAKHGSLTGAPIFLTCGGWLDQVSQPDYYPRWAYTFKLNWAVRIWREPRRLWRRYTVDAVAAIRMRKDILPVGAEQGIRRHNQAVGISSV